MYDKNIDKKWQDIWYENKMFKTGEDKNKKKIAEKQKKIADTFKKIANAIKIKNKTGEAKSSKEVEKLDKEKFKTSDVLDKIPDSSNSVLF